TLHRCDVVSDHHDNGHGDGAYLLHCNGSIPAGGFQNWRDGNGWENWRADIGRKLTADELEELRERTEADRRQREAEEAERHAEAAQRAADIWFTAEDCAEHPYLARKVVKAHGATITGDGRLVLPLRDAEGGLHSLQFIAPDGGKMFLADGRVSGCYFTLGGRPSGVLLIGEGFATCASAYEISSCP